MTTKLYTVVTRCTWLLALILVMTNSHIVLAKSKSKAKAKRTHDHNIVDNMPVRDDKAILKLLCDKSTHHEKQISKVSTIVWLHNHFQQLDSAGAKKVSSKKAACRDRYLETLANLHKVVTVSNEDVCSDQKVTLIEEFHRKHIVAPLTKKHKPGHGIVHDPLRVFFMQYAIEVTQVCQKHLLTNLKLPLVASNVNATLNGGQVDANLNKLVEGLHKYLGSPNSFRDYDDFVLIWNMIDDYNRRKGKDPINEELIDEATGERVGLMVKVNSAAPIVALQQKCRRELRPIYGRIVLPLMRLVDLGYYRKWGANQAQVAKDLSSDKPFGHWYSLAQACESLLPIRLYQDETLQPKEVVMITKEEAKKLASKSSDEHKSGDELMETVNGSIIKHSLGGGQSATGNEDHQLKSVRQEKPRRLMKMVKNNLKSRNKAFKRILRKLASDLKGKLKPMVKNFFVSRKGPHGDSYVKEEAESLINNSLVKANKYLKETDNSVEALTRDKRCVSVVVILAIIAIVVFVIIIIVLLVIFVG